MQHVDSPGTLWASTALTGSGWAHKVAISIGDSGRITSVQADSDKNNADQCFDLILPAPPNLHSHAFQRALAGWTESRGQHGHDSFWTWRDLMYRFLARLGPPEVEAISAYVYMQMLQAGYGAVGEFHYLHHQPDGRPYTDMAELSQRVASAARQTGIGLTLLPVLYQQGGCDGRALNDSQRRFGNTLDEFAQLAAGARNAVRETSADSSMGVAPHSMRALPVNTLQRIHEISEDGPIHLHIAEQTAEVDEVLLAFGQRPVQWLLDHCPVDQRWCLIHATHMTPAETRGLAGSGAVAGLCPITEANLGDGIFDARRFVEAGGRFGIGSDSNVRISLTEELRVLEYSQRLKEQARVVIATDSQSNGRVLFEGAARGGAQAIGRDCGTISSGQWADLVALDGKAAELSGCQQDTLLDAFIFAGGDTLVTDVWSAGRHVVRDGHHIHHDKIRDRFVKTMQQLRDTI